MGKKAQRPILGLGLDPSARQTLRFALVLPGTPCGCCTPTIPKFGYLRRGVSPSPFWDQPQRLFQVRAPRSPHQSNRSERLVPFDSKCAASKDPAACHSCPSMESVCRPGTSFFGPLESLISLIPRSVPSFIFLPWYLVPKIRRPQPNVKAFLFEQTRRTSAAAGGCRGAIDE